MYRQGLNPRDEQVSDPDAPKRKGAWQDYRLGHDDQKD